MKILAIDTATPSCSVALTDGETLLSEVTVKTGRSHSRHIMEIIRQVLALSVFNLEDIDGFAVSRGPGSFTGLRIGISTVKGYAFATAKPMVGVSSLRSLAAQAPAGTDLICPMLDARKKEVYYALYRYDGGTLIRQGNEGVLPPDKITGRIETTCLFIGTGALAYRSVIEGALGRRAQFAPEGHHIIRASTLAFLSRDRFVGADPKDAADFVPTYIRKPDAVLNRPPSRLSS